MLKLLLVLPVIKWLPPLKEMGHVWLAEHILGKLGGGWRSQQGSYYDWHQRLQILLKAPTLAFPFSFLCCKLFSSGFSGITARNMRNWPWFQPWAGSGRLLHLLSYQCGSKLTCCCIKIWPSGLKQQTHISKKGGGGHKEMTLSHGLPTLTSNYHTLGKNWPQRVGTTTSRLLRKTSNIPLTHAKIPQF